MNLPMVLAAAGAVVVGRASDAAALLFLFSLSSTLESVAVAKTRLAIEGLIHLRPSEAWKVADRVDQRVTAYDSIPTNAEIVEERTKVDKSAMTGDSMPVESGRGDLIVGGT
ncbi:MAG: hypothetical protein ACO1SV_07275 [Fimbriimonas sp.]